MIRRILYRAVAFALIPAMIQETVVSCQWSVISSPPAVHCSLTTDHFSYGSQALALHPEAENGPMHMLVARLIASPDVPVNDYPPEVRQFLEGVQYQVASYAEELRGQVRKLRIKQIEHQTEFHSDPQPEYLVAGPQGAWIHSHLNQSDNGTLIQNDRKATGQWEPIQVLLEFTPGENYADRPDYFLPVDAMTKSPTWRNAIVNSSEPYLTLFREFLDRAWQNDPTLALTFAMGYGVTPGTENVWVMRPLEDWDPETGLWVDPLTGWTFLRADEYRTRPLPADEALSILHMWARTIDPDWHREIKSPLQPIPVTISRHNLQALIPWIEGLPGVWRNHSRLSRRQLRSEEIAYVKYLIAKSGTPEESKKENGKNLLRALIPFAIPAAVLTGALFLGVPRLNAQTPWDDDLDTLLTGWHSIGPGLHWLASHYWPYALLGITLYVGLGFIGRSRATYRRSYLNRNPFHPRFYAFAAFAAGLAAMASSVQLWHLLGAVPLQQWFLQIYGAVLVTISIGGILGWVVWSIANKVTNILRILAPFAGPSPSKTAPNKIFLKLIMIVLSIAIALIVGTRFNPDMSRVSGFDFLPADWPSFVGDLHWMASYFWPFILWGFALFQGVGLIGLLRPHNRRLYRLGKYEFLFRLYQIFQPLAVLSGILGSLYQLWRSTQEFSPLQAFLQVGGAMIATTTVGGFLGLYLWGSVQYVLIEPQASKWMFWRRKGLPAAPATIPQPRSARTAV